MPLLREHALQRCFAISPSMPGRIAVEELHHRHLRAEPRPHRAELEPDRARADHDEPLGHPVERERAGRRHDALLVDRARRASGADSEPVAIRIRAASSVRVAAVDLLDLDAPGRRDRARARDRQRSSRV